MASTGWRSAVSGRTLSIRVVTSRTQFGPPCRNGLKVRLAPGVVDDHENAAVAERLAELRRGGVDRLQPRPLAGQQHDQVGEDRKQPLGLLAELGPQDSVEIGVLDVGVVGERLGERRLAVAAGALERRGDAGDRVALGVEELLPSARRIPSGAQQNPRGGSGAIIGTRFCRLSASRTRISVV